MPGDAIVAVDATVSVAKHPPPFRVYCEIVKVQQITTARAAEALQADNAHLDRIVWRSVDRNPISAAVISGSDIKVPDVIAAAGPIWVARAGNRVARSKKTEGRTIVVPRDYDGEDCVCNPKGRSHIDGC